MFSSRQFPKCVECDMKGIATLEAENPITNSKMKKLLDVPTKLYEESSFLRSIKSNYLRFGNLSEKQVEAFKKVVKELKEGKTKESEE